MRISSIDGMRALFALWVMMNHIIGRAGFTKNALWRSFKYILEGEYAVDLFIIISGFVIFFLLDNKKETYLPYITRRFFRLFPVFILLFAIAIPTFTLVPQNAESYAHLYAHKQFPHMEYITSWWEHIGLHIAAHITMLHGIIPETVAPGAPIAFLPLAWSISLEWQFYILAPFFFYLVKRSLVDNNSAAGAIGFLLCILAVSLILKKVYPTVLRGAFLPYHIQFFIIGWVSYFFSKHLSLKSVDRDFVLLICIVLVVALNSTTHAFLRVSDIFPVLIWLMLFPFVISSNKGWLVQKLSVALENKIITYLGKISYSIYLSHTVVITLVITALSPIADEMNSMQFLMIFMPTTIVSTLIFSSLLHHFIEVPGIKLGVTVSKLFTKDERGILKYNKVTASATRK